MDHWENRKFRKYLIYIIITSCILITWKVLSNDTGKSYTSEIIDCSRYLQEKLHLTPLQKMWLTKLDDIPIIYAITPTYARHVQKAELTRISQTLMLVPNVHWIVVEDSEDKTSLVSNLIADSGLKVTHLVAKTPPFEKLQAKDPRWKRHRGVEQRNKALLWLRSNLQLNTDKGYVYFMDDDNVYSIKVFSEIMKIKKVGVWPVGLVGGLNVETPILDPETGKVKAYKSGWKPNRPFAIDMAGFAINLDLILEKTDANFSYKMEKGFQESQFLSYFTKKEDLEPLADNCTKVYVWHTRSEKPLVNGVVVGYEV
ncbi:unnamed protein product [Phyllotreta striolata]|uniref:Galactosylgalactosylxylosylprotein 3-beta-glucuronosyltransferase n=1 Tax=Phyllotreta striolata TaxID=444603 RepID=A0A9N9T9U5_PHYSR|nr:unnamed protein product [Phyllotreta striolata]